MPGRVLVTGGAGFIGRHVVQSLKESGYEPRVLDCFHSQVHGEEPARDDALDGIEVIDGDVRNASVVTAALDGVDHVIHLAAEVGVGQSMYEISRYTAVNDLGTAVLLQALTEYPVERFVVASSMSVYGEGLYRDSEGCFVEDARRGHRDQGWDPLDSERRPLEPVPTPEWKRPSLSSVYALNKFTQEQMALIVAPAYGCEAVALRLFNVYGPGQALSNPYTGVLAIFAARILNGKPPMIFEDGRQRRDFVHVQDVARAFVLALEKEAASGQTINIASGRSLSIEEVASGLLNAMDRRDLESEFNGKMRAGDIRHCIADISKAQEVLGFAPRQPLEEGLAALADWVASQTADDRVHEARDELERRGLVL
jgi:dTDP-L-rhamnose 4-epimerase